jgi:hypothetical protein
MESETSILNSINFMTIQKSPKSRSKIRVTDGKARPQSPLVSSPAVATREIANLRRGRERLETTPTAADTDVRTTLI